MSEETTTTVTSMLPTNKQFTKPSTELTSVKNSILLEVIFNLLSFLHVIVCAK